MTDAARASLVDAVRSSGLAGEGPGLALCSGGADSSGLLAGLAGAVGPGLVLALHLNYGLRPDSGAGEAACVSLCRELGVELVVERPSLPDAGNLQANAREARYATAERLRRERGLEWIATGHTRTDLAETVVYRLATSPGRRALLGLRSRRGHVVRPLLDVSREQLREWVLAAGLPFRDDPTNAETIYARNRIRHQVLPVLGELSPAVEATIAETRAELAEEAETLDRLVAEALAASGAEASGALGVED
ncbi:MAG: tRNA lysidine(34) synthetase TilS, partial [Actinomycetota bacterium]|nr:tRNA lysidine(34) synthetase TilS [Actinomycetota bacterium]